MKGVDTMARGKETAKKPLTGYTAEESALVRAYRKELQKAYWERKTPEERREIRMKNELRAAIKAAERRKAQEEAAGLV